MGTYLATFRANERGNFGVISSIIAVPLVLSVGLALDLSTISRTRAELQSAMDAAALAVAREGKDISDAKAQDIADRFLDDNFDPKYTKLVVVRDGTAFRVTAETKANLAFGALFGYDDWRVDAAATADIAYSDYEIALVLDTTGSMAGGKLAAMKDAVIGMIQNMELQVKTKESLKFALVPFATYVNVSAGFGPSFDENGKQVAGTGAAWLDLEGRADMPQSELDNGASRFQLYNNFGVAWPGCVETRHGENYDVDDTPAELAEPATLYVPAFAIDEPDTGGFRNSYLKSFARPNVRTKAEQKSRWAKYGVAVDQNGKVKNGGLLDLTDRAVLDELLGEILTFGKKKMIKFDRSGGKGPDNGCTVQPISPLNSDYHGMAKKVESLEANGTTNIMEGVAWGLRVLSPGEPFAETKSAKKDVEQVMVVLTDGANVFGNANNTLGSSYSSFGYLVDGRLGITAGGGSATNALMNERTLAACQNAKDNGIEVYTIRLEEPDVATGDMLKKCATDEAHYFDVPSRKQLDDAFSKIGERIVKVRLAS